MASSALRSPWRRGHRAGGVRAEAARARGTCCGGARCPVPWAAVQPLRVHLSRRAASDPAMSGVRDAYGHGICWWPLCRPYSGLGSRWCAAGRRPRYLLRRFRTLLVTVGGRTVVSRPCASCHYSVGPRPSDAPVSLPAAVFLCAIRPYWAAELTAWTSPWVDTAVLVMACAPRAATLASPPCIYTCTLSPTLSHCAC